MLSLQSIRLSSTTPCLRASLYHFFRQKPTNGEQMLRKLCMPRYCHNTNNITKHSSKKHNF